MVTSSEGLTNTDPWLYRQGYNNDSWLLPHTFSHDNDLLTKALHTTVASSSSPSSVFFNSISPTLSEHETEPKRKRNSPVPVTNSPEGNDNNQSTKRRRRTRVSKKSMTTYITTDPSNFRQMVQQVTGAKFLDDDSSSSGVFAPIAKPEPVKLVNRVPCGVTERSMAAVPTLDTSAFLSNHREENLVVGNVGVGLTSEKVNSGGSAVEFDSYPDFPTLESWKVV